MPLSSLILARTRELREFETKNENAIAELKEDIELREHNAFDSFQLCPLGKLNLTDIHWKKFSTVVRDQFYNPEVMTMAACVATAAIVLPSSSDSNTIQLERIRHWFRRLSMLSSGAYGETLRAALDGGNQDFVIKVPSDEDASESLFHEMMVGLLVTNSLRKLVPNFAYVYGGFHCSHPIMNANGDQTVTFCNADDPLQYVIYENIQPAERADGFFSHCSRTEFFEILLQLVFALNIAFEKYDFTHYDFHAGNILIRKLPKRVSIRYDFAGQVVYVNTKYVATIIDFGFSHFRSNGNHGFVDAIFMDVMPDASYPMYDIFKFLWSSYRWSDNPIVQAATNEISAFFDSVDTISKLNTNAKLRNKDVFMPRTHPAVNWSFYDFFEYLNSNFSSDLLEVMSETAQEDILGCQGSKCPTSVEILNSIGYTNDGVPEDPFEFYDLYRSTGSLQLLQKYNYYQGFLNINRQVNAIIQRINISFQDLPQFIDVTKPSLVNQYLSQLDNLGFLITSLQSYASLVRVQNFMADIVSVLLGYTHSKLPFNYLAKVQELTTLSLAQVTQDFAAYNKLRERYASSPVIRKDLQRILQRLVWYNRLFDDWEQIQDNLNEKPSNNTVVARIRERARVPARRRVTIRPT